MNTRTKALLLTTALTILVGIFMSGQFAFAGGEVGLKKNQGGFTDTFYIEDCNFLSEGSNRFFILKPNYQLVLSGIEKGGAEIELTITVLNETKMVDGIQTRIVEEKETKNGQLVEIAKNYFAICTQTNSVFYFGEDVDFYEDDVIVSHDGSWLAGQNNAKAGLMMPGIVLLGSKFQQETAPKVAMDRALIDSMDKKVKTPAGTFEDVLRMKETTPLEPKAVEYKYYADGIGRIQDKNLKLEKYGFVE